MAECQVDLPTAINLHMNYAQEEERAKKSVLDNKKKSVFICFERHVVIEIIKLEMM